MLGLSVDDPQGVEGVPGACAGLGLLQVQTTLSQDKCVRQVRGEHVQTGAAVCGYEIHAGHTWGADTQRPVLVLEGNRHDGASDPSGQIWGTYVHGLFNEEAFRHAFLRSLRPQLELADIAFSHRLNGALNELATALAAHVDTSALLAAAR